MTHNLEVNFDTTTPFVKEDTAKELQNHAGKTQDTWVGAVENVEVAEIECVETMMSAELTEKSELLNLRHRIQFMQVDPEHVDECNPHSQNLAKWKRWSQGRSGQHENTAIDEQEEDIEAPSLS